MSQPGPPPIDQLRDRERAKYLELSATRPGYGASNHGKDAARMVSTLHRHHPDRIMIDVGAGRNDFAKMMRERGYPAIGVDFAFSEADLHAPAHEIPLPAGVASVVTAFDVLEHLLPDEVDEVLEELRRLAGGGGFVFSIAYAPSRITTKAGENLHPTVRPRDWWLEKIQAIANVASEGRFLWGRWR